MRQSQALPLPLAFRLGQRVFAGCYQSLLGVGLSRRYLCESFPMCLDPYPGCSWSAFTRFFLQDIGLLCVRTRSALDRFSMQRLQHGTLYRGCSHSLVFRPTDLLATPVAPTAVLSSIRSALLRVSCGVRSYRTGQPWLFHPSNVQFVTSLYVGYASRLNRAIDDRGLAPHKIRSLVGCSPSR
jgi:hypothetical protein